MLKRRPEFLLEVVRHVTFHLTEFYETKKQALNQSPHASLKQAHYALLKEMALFFPQGLLNSYYQNHRDLLFSCLKKIQKKDGVLSNSFFSIRYASFWNALETRELLKSNPVIFSLFCTSRKHFLKPLFRYIRHDPCLLQYVPHDFWENREFQEFFLLFVEENPSAFSYVLASYVAGEDAKSDLEAVSLKIEKKQGNFTRRYTQLLLKTITTSPLDSAFIEQLLKSPFNQMLLNKNARSILEKQPGFFCYLGEAARRDPALALLAVSHNGLLLEHVLLPARLNEEVIRTALNRSPECWKVTV